MQLTTVIPVIWAAQLLLLIATVYLAAFLKLCHNIGIFKTDVILAAAQLLHLILLCMAGLSQGVGLVLLIQCVFFALQAARLVWLARRSAACRRILLAPRSIRETIDTLPGGICFFAPGGRPILTNHRMNELVYRLTGHTVLNAQATWEELRRAAPANGCARLEDGWMRQGIPEGAGDEWLFTLPDHSVWRFRREELVERAPHYIQLEATEISELYRYSKKLYEDRQRLAQQFARRQNLLANIVEINREKEILQAKMRIHDALGRSILATKQHLRGGTLSQNIPRLAEVWNRTIGGLSGFAQATSSIETSPEAELQKAAEMIGCVITYEGERPTPRKTALLFYAAVREALTNAVMHAGANRLAVAIRPEDTGYHVEISDNGTRAVSSLAEGNGLGNLRGRLEQEGAALHIRCEKSVVLHIVLPYEEDASTREVPAAW